MSNAKTDKQIFMEKLCDEFKAFVADSKEMAEDFSEDHLAFFIACAEQFVDMKDEEASHEH
jgi:hypothetical protein